MLKIAVTGATGLIGSRITELLQDDFIFIPLLQEEFDITNNNDVKKILRSIQFDILFHLAAFTNVDGAEKNSKLAHAVNVEGTNNLYQETIKQNRKFIHVSTDFVFDGLTPPYTENSLPSDPDDLCVYGKTKLQSEQIVKKEAMIIRLAYPYRAYYQLKNDYVQGIVSVLKNNRKLEMVADCMITPTFVDDIAHALKYLFNNFSKKIYHLVGADSLSPYESAVKIAKVFSLNQSLISKISFEQYYFGKAKRPRSSIMKSINNNFYKMRTFEEGLSELKKQISKLSV